MSQLGQTQAINHSPWQARGRKKSTPQVATTMPSSPAGRSCFSLPSLPPLLPSLPPSPLPLLPSAELPLPASSSASFACRSASPPCLTDTTVQQHSRTTHQNIVHKSRPHPQQGHPQGAHVSINQPPQPCLPACTWGGDSQTRAHVSTNQPPNPRLPASTRAPTCTDRCSAVWHW